MKKGIIAAIGICLALAGAGVASADDITADVITYNGKTKVVSASGNVVIHANQGATITGKSGEYRFEDRSAYLEGGVHYVKEQTTMDASKVDLYSDKTVHAVGHVVINERVEKRILKGDDVTYNPDTGDGNIQGNGYVSTEDGVVTAPHIYGNLKAIRILGDGGVHMTSEVHKLTAYGDQAVYTRTPNKNDGVLYLKGHARAEQNGNTFAGPELILRDDNQTMETNGRSTLTITNTSGSK